MNIAVLFDGAGLARLGLERAGHKCTGIELDSKKHLLSTFVGSGNCILGDATKQDLSKFDAIWASPPCIRRSVARVKDTKVRNELYSVDYVDWCLKNIKNDILWVECTLGNKDFSNDWGKKFNAAQFLETPIQGRNRIIGGRYVEPKVFRSYKHSYKKEFNICPAILATEYKQGWRAATQWYGRKLTIEECAYHQGFEIPSAWYDLLERKKETKINLSQIYEAIGNGVPVYMSKAFGECYQ